MHEPLASGGENAPLAAAVLKVHGIICPGSGAFRLDEWVGAATVNEEEK